MMTFGRRLKLILEFADISQRTFAHTINTSESQLSKLLNDKKKPTTKELEAIIKALGIPYDCIVGNVEIFDGLLLRRSLWDVK